MRSKTGFHSDGVWHRIVLDECQEIKSPTTAIATMCAGLQSRHRYYTSDPRNQRTGGFGALSIDRYFDGSRVRPVSSLLFRPTPVAVLSRVQSLAQSRTQSRARWMVSGTPLVSTINDLHGELQFLNIWPFSLNLDGFWERKVRHPPPLARPLTNLTHAASWG